MFICVDLKVIEGLAAQVARAAGCNEDRVLAGLVRLWHRVWSDEADLLSLQDLAGIFGTADLGTLIDALVTNGFLEETGDVFRVRGASRYLKLKASRRRGGQAAAGNLRRGSSSPALEPGGSRGAAGAQPELGPALTPSHRVTESLKKKKNRANARPPNPRHTPMKSRLWAVFRGVIGADYPIWDGQHADALSKLLDKYSSDDELAALFDRALRHQGFPEVRSLPELLKHLPHFVGGDAAPLRAAGGGPLFRVVGPNDDPYAET